ncbi:MAG: ferritin family protein [Planctomycetota bacterium]
MTNLFFSADEVIEVAVKIEENGSKFYLTCANNIKDDNLKKVFKHLANEENRHMDIFHNLFEKLRNKKIDNEIYTEEANTYMTALSDSRVFSSESEVVKFARGTKDVLSLLSYAIGAEKDSVLFYLELLPLTTDADKEIVESIIKEEKKHIVELTSLKKEISRRV